MAAVPKQTRAGYLLMRCRALVCFGDESECPRRPGYKQKNGERTEMSPRSFAKSRNPCSFTGIPEMSVEMGVEIVWHEYS
jgi:hypothetical protein